MNNIKRKFLIELLVIVAVLSMIIAGVAYAIKPLSVNASEVDIVETSELNPDGAWGYEEIISRPTGKIRYNDVDKEADVKVIFPDGTESVGKNDVIKLNVEGEYTVEYSADFDGQVVSKTDSFVIEKELFYVTSDSSSAKYYNYVYKDHVTEDKSSARDSVINSSVSGVYVSLASGDEFKYSRVIDLTKVKATDNLIKIVIAPNRIGVKDVSDFSITLTDAYDPTNYVTFKAYSRSETPMVYISVAASNGQQQTGWQFSTNPVKQVNNNYGAPSRFSLTGPYATTEQEDGDFKYHNDVKFKINGIADNDFSINFDYESKKVFNKTSTNYDGASSYPSKSKDDIGLIADLDSPEDFSKIWGGFTTGECFLSIKGGTYLEESFNFMITEICGITGSLSGADDAKQEEIFSFEDRGTLDIDVDFEDYSAQSLPKAKVGVEYPIFNASTLNQYFGKLPVSYEVSKDDTVVAYNGEKFVPETAGDYTLTYTVKDYFKKESTYSVTITAVEQTSAIQFDLAGLDAIFATDEIEEVGVSGKFVKLHMPTNMAGGCANGIFKFTTKVYLGENEVDVVDGKFFPTIAGEYKVTVTATDYVGQTYAKEYTVTVETGDCAVYLEKPAVPKYFVSGKTYKLPMINAYDYTDGSGNPVKAKIAYIDGEGVKKSYDGKITPVATLLKNTVDIIYYTDSIYAEGNVVYSDIPLIDINVKNDGEIIEDYSKLFVSSDMSLKMKGSNVQMQTQTDASATFVNAMGANGLSVRIVTNNDKKDYKAFTITYTDSENDAQSIKFYYILDDTVNFKINSLDALVSYKVMDFDIVILEYDSVNGVRYDRKNGAYAPIDTYLNGQPFEGFSSGKVYVTFGFEQVEGDAEIELTQISGEKFNGDSDPVFTFEGEYRGYVTYGEKIRIPKMIASDLISPYVDSRVTVQLPETTKGVKVYAKAVDGTRLFSANTDKDYFVTAIQYGRYVVTFQALNPNGEVIKEFSYYVNVVDTVAPEITMPNGTVSSGKVNKNIKLTMPTVTDNVDTDVKVEIYIYSPSMVMYKLEDGKTTFKTNKAGKYKVVYKATDSAGNYSTKTIELFVSDK